MNFKKLLVSMVLLGMCGGALALNTIITPTRTQILPEEVANCTSQWQTSVSDNITLKSVDITSSNLFNFNVAYDPAKIVDKDTWIFTRCDTSKDWGYFIMLSSSLAKATSANVGALQANASSLSITSVEKRSSTPTTSSNTITTQLKSKSS